MPSLRPLPDACAILTDYNMGKGGGNCPRPATVRAVWRFDKPGPRRIQLCDQHAAAGHERLTLGASLTRDNGGDLGMRDSPTR